MIDEVIAGRYEIRARLGSGGMADVYEAFDRTLGRPVALKLLRAGLSADRVFVDRFTREARSAASINHRRVVGVLDAGSDDGRHFDQRFADTVSINADSAVVTSRGLNEATVSVYLTEVTSAGTRHFSGTWYLIRSGNSWLMDAPSLGPA